MNKKWEFINNGKIAIIKECGKLPDGGMIFCIPLGQSYVCRQFNKPDDLLFQIRGGQVALTIDLSKDSVSPEFKGDIDEYMIMIGGLLNNAIEINTMILG